MFNTDRDAFEQMLAKLTVAFPREITDELRDVYWNALKDLPIRTVQRLAAVHLKFGKFFPKPKELRPKGEEAPSMTADSPAVDAAEKRSIRNLEALRASDPERWRAEVKARMNARILATAHEGSPEYAEARRTDAELRRAAGWISSLRLEKTA